MAGLLLGLIVLWLFCVLARVCLLMRGTAALPRPAVVLLGDNREAAEFFLRRLAGWLKRYPRSVVLFVDAIPGSEAESIARIFFRSPCWSGLAVFSGKYDGPQYGRLLIDARNLTNYDIISFSFDSLAV